MTINARSSRGIYLEDEIVFLQIIPSVKLLDQQVIVSISRSNYANIHRYVSLDIHWIEMPRQESFFLFQKQ